MFEIKIPQITDEELLERYNRIKPIVKHRGKKYYLEKLSLEQIKTEYYLWDPKFEREVEENELVDFCCDFSCLHRYGYPGLFRPSVKEVLSQLDKNYIPILGAFEIIEFPETAEDFYKTGLHRIVFENGYHVSTVRLYCKKTDSFCG